MASSHKESLLALCFMASKSFWLLGGHKVSELCPALFSAAEVIMAFIILIIAMNV